MNNERGFTLLELTAVLVIIGLVAAFMPLFLDSVIAERALEKEVAHLGDTIELLLRQSVLDGVSHAIHYDTEKERWAMQLPVEHVYEDPAGDDGEGEEVRALLLEPGEPDDLDWHDLPDGIDLRLYEGRDRIADGRYRVELSPRGTVDPHALVLISDDIRSLDDDERARTIKVNFSGIISYLPGIRTEEFKKTEVELGR
ncbi:MAG: type II secretion system protein [Planctomycetota bacterium]